MSIVDIIGIITSIILVIASFIWIFSDKLKFVIKIEQRHPHFSNSVFFSVLTISAIIMIIITVCIPVESSLSDQSITVVDKYDCDRYLCRHTSYPYNIETDNGILYSTYNKSLYDSIEKLNTYCVLTNSNNAREIKGLC